MGKTLYMVYGSAVFRVCVCVSDGGMDGWMALAVLNDGVVLFCVGWVSILFVSGSVLCSVRILFSFFCPFLAASFARLGFPFSFPTIINSTAVAAAAAAPLSITCVPSSAQAAPGHMLSAGKYTQTHGRD